MKQINEKLQARVGTSQGKSKKERTISAIVKKKIQSGLEKEHEINELLYSKEYIHEKLADDDL